MMPVQTMSDPGDVHVGSQFAQGNCHIDNEKASVVASNVRSLLDHSTVQSGDGTQSTMLNGHVHLESTTSIHLDHESNDLNGAMLKIVTGPFSISPEPAIPPSVEEESDDFCDFEGYTELEEKTFQAQDHSKIDDDAKFANFTLSNVVEEFSTFDHSNWTSTAIDNQPTSVVEDDFGDDDFADFECASNDKQSTLPEQLVHQPVQPSVPTNSYWGQLFQSTFPETVKLSDYLPDSDSATSSDITSQIFEHGSPRSQALWESIQVMDLKSICLLHKWKDSRSFQRLMQALKVDGSIIQLNSDIFPTYSSHYGHILEPISVSSWGPTVQESANINNLSDSMAKAKHSNDSTLVGADGELQSVFSLNQDLDLFESKYSHSKNGNSQNLKPIDLISEFESIILDSESSLQNRQQHKQASSTDSPNSSVTDIQKMLQSSMNAQTSNEQVLSAEALQILNELPTLSFVRANVLMFPINERN